MKYLSCFAVVAAIVCLGILPTRNFARADDLNGLLARLKSSDSLVRYESAKAVHRLGPAAKSALSELIAASHDTIWYVRKEAAAALDDILASDSETPAQAWRLIRSPYSRKVDADARTVVCELAAHPEKWAQAEIKQGELSPAETWENALLNLKMSFLARAASACGTEIGDSSETSSHWRESNRKIIGRSTGDTAIPWSAADSYGKQFYLLTLQNFRALARTDAERERFDASLDYVMFELGRELVRAMAGANLTYVFPVEKKILNSGYNTFTFASAILSAPAHAESGAAAVRGAVQRLVDVVAAAENPMALPYEPRAGSYRDTTVRGSAARNVPVHLALFLRDRDPARRKKNRRNLWNAVETWLKYADDLKVNMSRDQAHVGKDWIAPYYFYPSAAYVGAAIRVLREKGEPTSNEGDRLNQMSSIARDAILDLVQDDGLFIPQGGAGYRDTRYPTSPEYVNPLAGLALLPLLESDGDQPGFSGILPD